MSEFKYALNVYDSDYQQSETELTQMINATDEDQGPEVTVSVLATRNVADRIAPAFVARQFGMPTPSEFPIYFGLNVNNKQPIVEGIDEDDGYVEPTQ